MNDSVARSRVRDKPNLREGALACELYALEA